MIDWNAVADELNRMAQQSAWWKFGQDKTINFMAKQLRLFERHGVLIADEVGMGKTRVAMAAILAVMKYGGSVAVVVPPGLMHQWDREWRSFKAGIQEQEQYRSLPLKSFFSLLEDPDVQFPLSRNNRWLLLSHQFGIPRIQATKEKTSKIWKYGLPLLAVTLQLMKDDIPKKNKFYQALTKNTDEWRWDDECLNGICASCSRQTQVDCQFDIQMRRAADFLIADEYWQEKLRNFYYDNNACDIRSAEGAKEFFHSSSGHRMLSDLLGPIDLLVIDEAHKGKGQESQIGKLLDFLKLTESTKRIALTATPMELNSEQWETIFNRIGESKSYPRDVIKTFENARNNANRSPDNLDNIQSLIKASQDFYHAMTNFVTRRKRIDQDQMQALIGKIQNGGAHPHRQENSIELNLIDKQISDVWRRAIFALESTGKAAKGFNPHCKNEQLTLSLKKWLQILKLTDIRHASGHISLDIGTLDSDQGDQPVDIIPKELHDYLEQTKEVTDVETKRNRGKALRLAHWRQVLSNDQIEGDLASHPRVLRVANRIEEILLKESPAEKILVFGTFKRPLQALHELLNHRAILRLLDKGLPCWVPESKLTNHSIWIEYQRIKKYSSVPFTQNLKDNIRDETELGEKIKEGRIKYAKLRDRLLHINENFLQQLPGDAAIARTCDKTRNTLIQILRTRIINDWIACGEVPENINLFTKEIRSKALCIWCDYLRPYIENENTREKSKSSITPWRGASNLINIDPTAHNLDLKEVDRIADNLDEKEIASLIERESDELGLTTQFKALARLLTGDTKMETRHILQAQFNTKNAFPRVLIAQSQVGREGLNLHSACRRIILFHPEWNPGVIEQQIGRVDRISSFWESLAEEWKRNGKQGDMPKIEIEHVVFNGTYDAYQSKVSQRRDARLKAHLFGELLNEQAASRVQDKDLIEELRQAAPNFKP